MKHSKNCLSLFTEIRICNFTHTAHSASFRR